MLEQVGQQLHVDDAILHYPVSGGEIDGGVISADIYVDAPVEATVPDHHACRMAKRYLDMINSKDLSEIPALFEDDAVHLGGLATRLRGPDEITAFFVDKIVPMDVKVVPVAFGGSGDDCLVSIAVERMVGGERRFALTVVDHVTIGASGKIKRLVAFMRPGD
ncbi:nuclear transport factor 2 family protein [Sphingobium sp.]|uniref:nuclear transport factor 2 family protein n=1 Tax=Sphingobium sp. TaxID=1912891 RepID=UPI003B3AF617